MKFKFLFFHLFLAFCLNAQTLKTVELFPPESTEHSDLAFLKEELNHKPYVLLGEYTHMYGNIFEMKIRVIEFLHKELGFNTIAMETPMYDIWKMNQKGFDKEKFNQAIWGVWSSTSEFQRLVNYIEQNNIKVIGFDSQVKDATSFTDDFFQFLEDNHIEIKLDKDDLGIVIETVLESAEFENDDIQYPDYEKEMTRILKKVEQLEHSTNNFYWKQFIKSLLANSKTAYYNQEEEYSFFFGNKNDNFRDTQMADNLLNYLHQNSYEKVIVWADNIHLMNNHSSVKIPTVKDFVSMGNILKKELKNNVYSLATIHANDSIWDYGVKRWEQTPIKKNSFEYKLKQQNKPYLFVSSNQSEMQQQKETRLISFSEFTELRLDELHDGYIFFKHATLPKNERESIVKQKKQINHTKNNPPITKIEYITLKGQVLEKETDFPISYANLIIRNQELFRVANEDGYYEIQIDKNALSNDSIEISYEGYEPKFISLNQLTNKVYLNSNFVELDEVVFTAKRSPESVLKKAIEKKEENHPTEPFNFFRYSRTLVGTKNK